MTKIFPLFTLLLFAYISLNSQNSVATSTGNSVYNIIAGNAIVIDANIEVQTTSDITGAKVMFNSGYLPSEDRLVYPSVLHGITGSFNTTTGILTLSGTGSGAEYQDVLRSIQYDNIGSPPTPGNRDIIFSIGTALPFYPCGATEPHFYELILSFGNDWIGAKNDADSKTFFGLQGYLATIMCEEENTFITEKLDASGFIGGSDNPAQTGSTQHNWYWVTGPEAGTLFTQDYQTPVTGVYENWNTGEPNNSDGQEDYACIYGLSHPAWGSTGFWNDVRQFPIAGDLIEGYVIEYGGMPGDPPLDLADNKTVVVTESILTNLPVSGSTVCEGEDGTATLQNTENGIDYEAFIGVTSFGTQTGNGGNLTYTIPAANLSVGDNIVSFTGDNGSGAVNMDNNATIIVNSLPNSGLTVTGSEICDGENGTITIESSENGVSYEFLIGASLVATANGDGNDLNVNISNSDLSLGSNTISITASNGSCSSTLPSATITVNSSPNSGLTVTGSEICEGEDGTVTIESSENGVTYEFFIGATSVATANGDGNDLNVNITISDLSLGSNTISITASNGNCSSTLPSATISVNSSPNSGLTVTGSEICEGENGTIIIENSENGVSYELMIGATSVATETGDGSNLNIDISSSDLIVGNNVILITANNGQCTANLPDATITVHPIPNSGLTVTGSEICEGENGTITIESSENGVSYNFMNGASSIATSSGNGSNLNVEISNTNLNIGSNIIAITADNGHCSSELSDAAITVNQVPDNTLSISGTSVCMNEDGLATVQNSENSITYEVFVNSASIGNAIGSGGDLTFSIPYQNLQNGENTISFYAENNGNCRVQLLNETIINVNGFDITDLQTVGSSIELAEDGTINIQETENQISYQFYLSGENDLITQTVGNGAEALSIIPAEYLEIGDNLFEIIAVNETCTLKVGEDVIVVTKVVVVPDCFTPNANGINDYYIMRGIEEYTSNSVKIFNRWGNIVYEAIGYDNTNTVWDGRANRGVSIGSDYLPEGNYFILIDLGDNSKLIKKTIYLKR